MQQKTQRQVQLEITEPTRGGRWSLDRSRRTEIGKQPVPCDRSQLVSSYLCNVQVRERPPTAPAISGIHDHGYLYGFDAQESKSIAA